MNKLSNQPPKGTSDWFPEEFKIRKYIFDTWRKVCTSFGYEEYLTPQIELADVYRAKSGEDLGGKELWTLTDLAGREFAIRPEMTPSVTRMVTRIYQDTPKPIRLFSIANFMRNEKPQRGRNREFWQLNFDIFGTDSINADVEVLQIAVEIMRAFGATKDMFKIKINHRYLTEAFSEEVYGIKKEVMPEVFKVLDKKNKLEEKDFIDRLSVTTGSNAVTMTSYTEDLAKSGYLISYADTSKDEKVKAIKLILDALEVMGLGDYFQFDTSLARGLDYYDGMVFEVFDKNPENNRSMFGGGRYNGLASLFGSESFPAVGCAPGDETTRLFLESWNLLDQVKGSQIEKYYLPILSESLIEKRDLISEKLRAEGKVAIDGLELQKLGKALEWSNKKGVDFVVILGEEEEGRGVYKVKNMKSGEEREVKL